MRKIISSILQLLGERDLNFKIQNRILYYSALILFFVSIFLLMFESENLINTIGSDVFTKYLILKAFIFSISILVILYLSSNEILYSTKKYNLICGLVFGLSISTPLTYSIINRSFASQKIESFSTQIVKKKTGGRTGKIYFISFKINANLEKFRIKKALWNNLFVGQRVDMKMKKGYFNKLFYHDINPIE